MIEYQYLVGGALSLVVSAYVILKCERTRAMTYLFLFGLTVLSWEVSAFLSITAGKASDASVFLALNMMTSHLSFPVYLLTVLSIQKRRSRRLLLLALVPAAVDMLVFPDFIANLEVYSSKSGWAYRIIGYNTSFLVNSIIFFGYLVSVFVVLLNLTRKARLPLLRRKYRILLLSYTLFQAVGTILTNALLSLNLLDPDYRVGGLLQFLTFLSIWYALTLKTERAIIPIGSESFDQVYSSFLTVFFDSVTGSLGEEVYRFRDFVEKSNIEKQVSINDGEVTFVGTEETVVAGLIARNLSILDDRSVEDEVIDSYLRVLNAAEKRLGSKFEAIVDENENFLKKSDLIYGVSDGKYLWRIAKDESLTDLDDVEACLKIYKRILLPIASKVQKVQQETSKYYNDVKISTFGEISVKGIIDSLLEVPGDECLRIAVERFNSILTSIFEDLLTDRGTDMEGILDKLRLVLRLNKAKADELGIYLSLLGTLATRIPRSQIHKLYSDYLEELVDERTRELQEAQKKLLESQRMATIGEAAAMVGHDLRNPLQAIVNMMYLMKEKLNSTSLQGSEVLKLAETVEEQVRYMNKIVSDLQDYARPLKVELAQTDLHKLINETLSNINVPDNVEVSVMIEDDLDFPKLMIDPALMKRVFINLITNALQAMLDGGHLKIMAERTEESTLISIQDTGVGISEENMDKIFQPLFTTKAKGQGLGLAVCKRLVEAHNGSITFMSDEEGSTFTVKLPLQSDVKAPQIAARTV